MVEEFLNSTEVSGPNPAPVGGQKPDPTAHTNQTNWVGSAWFVKENKLFRTGYTIQTGYWFKLRFYAKSTIFDWIKPNYD